MLTFKKFIKIKELFDNDLGANNINPIHASLPRTNIQMGNLDEKEDINYYGLHDHLLNYYKPDKLSHSKKQILKNYTHHGGAEINNRLWEDYKHNQTDHSIKLKTRDKKVNDLDKIINSYKTPQKFHVYSSTIHDPEKLKNSEGIVHHPAFLSTSLDKKVATSRDINSQNDNKGNNHLHIIHMDIPEGHSGIYVAHPSISKFFDEKEFILPRGLNLRHLETKITRGQKDYNNKFTFIHHHQMEIL